MSVLNQSGEEQVECPLCMEPLEVDDLNFFPCTCGYQICRFCWHRIRTDENGLCPACRKAYPENPADFKPLSQEEVARLKAEKRHKDQQRKQKITENRKHLANVRVVQRNLVFVVGLPVRLADAEVLKKHEYFGKFGKIIKVVINQSTSYAGSQGPSASAYVTYHKADDALRAIQAVNNISVDGRTIKTSLGTTKYCSHFMKNQTCPKPDCMYLHELGDVEASFTKEEMQQGKHQEYEKKLHEQLLNAYNHNSASRERKPTPSPPAIASSIGSCQNVYQGSSSITSCSSSNSSSSSTTCNKEAWPSLQPGMTAPSNSGNSFGLSLGGNGSSSSSSNNSGNSSKIGNSRNQRFDQQTKASTNPHKKRHTSGEENRGKVKEKLQNSTQDEHGTKMVHGKSNSLQHSNPRSHKDSLSFQDLHQNVQHSVRSSNNSGSSSSETTSGPSTEVDSDLQESDENLGNVGHSETNGKQQSGCQNGARILPSNHRATLFEPDNNSFFSTNNFMKVAATATGSATTEWPINGLTLTHMPDVLPPVHSSEDWQAAFGFSNSPNPQNLQHEENSCVVTSDEQQIQSDSSGSSSKIDSGSVDRGYESGDQSQSQNFKNSCENKQSLVDNVTTAFPLPSTSNLSEDFGMNMSNSIHLPQKICANSSYIPEDVSTGNIRNDSLPVLQNSMNPAINSSSTGGPQVFAHASPFIHQDGTILMMPHHQFPVNLVNHIAGSQHLIANGLPPSHTPSKFITDFHLRQNLIKQLNPQPHLHNLDSANFGGRNANNLNMSSVSGKYNMIGGTDFNTPMGKGGGECTVNSEKLQNGGNIADGELVISDEDKYIPGFLDYRQNHIEQSIDLEYENGSENSEHLITAVMENGEELSAKDCGRLTDDELGFDPFHETQKALAEMMEKENMMLMMQDQQNKHQPSHSLLNQAHLHGQQGAVNNLTQHLYQQYQLNQMNHFNQVPHTSAFGGSKLLNSFTSRSQHILSQQNHRLPANVSGCAKLLDGLGLGPSNITPMGPSAHTRTRLPPPGFTTAPNHMNAFGLGIPRAPSNNSSKILPFMGLGNNPNSSNNGSSSPIPQNSLPNNIAPPPPLNRQQGTNQQAAFVSSTGHDATDGHTFGLQNGVMVDSSVPKVVGDTFNVKEWPENLRSLLPNLSSGSQNQAMQFVGTNTPPPPPGSLNTVFGAPHASIHGSTQKGWTGVGPCTDWTALDPAIVSSSRPHNFLAATSSASHHPPLNPSSNPGIHILHNANSILQQKQSTEQQNMVMSNPHPSSTSTPVPHLHQLQQNNPGHWARSPSSEENGCMYYGSNVLGTGSVEWTTSNSHLGSGNVQQQQTHLVGSPNSGSVMMAPPPPGFSSMRLAAMQQGTVVQKKQNSVGAEMGKIENATQSGVGILQTKEEDRLEDLR